MWHEARRREKETMRLMRENKRRGEKRREENKVDPTSLLLVNGLKASLSMDPNSHKQALRALVSWHGDERVKIDRFDVRATLTSLPHDEHVPSSRNPNCRNSDSEPKNIRPSGTVLDHGEDDAMKKLLNYERYRILIDNDLKQIPEDSKLRQVVNSDISSQAKLKKLSMDRFGTLGETFLDDTRDEIKFRRRNEAAEKRVSVAISYNYDAETTSDNKHSLRESDQAKTDPADLPILDHDPTDLVHLSDPDNIRILETTDRRRISDISRRYGLKGRDFILLNRYDNDNLSTKILMDELTNVSLRETEPSKDIEQVYGPPLPPELASGSSRQKSPKRSEPTPGKQDEQSNSNISLHRSQPKNQPDGGHGQSVVTRDERAKIDVQVPPEVQKSPITKRRASTPLAYKRNCRSSRSVSRDRSRHRHSHSRSHYKYDNRRRRSSSSQSSSSSSNSSRSRSYSSSSSSYSDSSSSDSEYERSQRSYTRRYKDNRRGKASQNAKRSMRSAKGRSLYR